MLKGVCYDLIEILCKFKLFMLKVNVVFDIVNELKNMYIFGCICFLVLKDKM